LISTTNLRVKESPGSGNEDTEYAFTRNQYDPKEWIGTTYRRRTTPLCSPARNVPVIHWRHCGYISNNMTCRSDRVARNRFHCLDMASSQFGPRATWLHFKTPHHPSYHLILLMAAPTILPVSNCASHCWLYRVQDLHSIIVL
jgi:hypothetical protein